MLKVQDIANRWGNLPSTAEFDRMHTESLIEELGDIRLDIGMYRRMLKNPELSDENRVIVNDLIELDTQRLYGLKMELENERARKAG